ncbi:MAG: nitronate monooxygenase, partial [Acidimicrobiales bacterium]|nr:nitronate monooxygenase [Acidimicrobiales bacterium]
MPMQFMLTSNAVQRGHMYPEQAKDVQFNPVGQIVGRMNKMRPAKDVIFEMVEECIESNERLERLMGQSVEA